MTSEAEAAAAACASPAAGGQPSPVRSGGVDANASGERGRSRIGSDTGEPLQRTRTGEAAELPTDAFEAWFSATLPAAGRLIAVRQLEGGRSNPTFKLGTEAGDHVLRRAPLGELLRGAHDVEREYRVLQALSRVGFPVPRPLALCTDRGVIGSAFYVMEFVEGDIFRDVRLSGARTSRRRYFDAMAETLARLHRIDPASVGLENCGRGGSYVSRQIERWSGHYLGDEEAGRYEAMDRLIDWLPGHVPSESASSIIHGDYRCDNLVFARSGPRLLAVLDWELSTIGDPLADFAYHLMMYRIPATEPIGLLGHDLAAAGIPSEEEFISSYCRAAGRTGIPHLEFYLAFCMFRLAAVAHGIRGRVMRGTATGDDAADVAGKVGWLAEFAWKQAMRAGAG